MSAPHRTLTLAITTGRNLSDDTVEKLLDAFKEEILAEARLAARANLLPEVRGVQIDERSERAEILTYIDEQITKLRSEILSRLPGLP